MGERKVLLLTQFNLHVYYPTIYYHFLAINDHALKHTRSKRIALNRINMRLARISSFNHVTHFNMSLET